MRGIEKLQKEHGKTKREYETQVPLAQNLVDSVKTLSTMKIREILRYQCAMLLLSCRDLLHICMHMSSPHRLRIFATFLLQCLLRMRMSQFMRMFRICGFCCEYSHHPYYSALCGCGCLNLCGCSAYADEDVNIRNIPTTIWNCES